MKKRIITALILSILLLGCFTGCQKEEPTNSSEVEVQKEANEVTEETTPAQICSLCEIEKLCATYTAEGQEYVVCPDDANEFMTAFAETADTSICSLCEEEKICGIYTVDGEEYVVCLDDYNEFAAAFELENE